MTLKDAKSFTEWVCLWLVVSWVASWALFRFVIPVDSTDIDRRHRSGLALHVDALTGCEYLATAKGGLTPRLNGSGRHVGCRSFDATLTAEDGLALGEAVRLPSDWSNQWDGRR